MEHVKSVAIRGGGMWGGGASIFTALVFGKGKVLSARRAGVLSARRAGSTDRMPLGVPDDRRAGVLSALRAGVA